MNNKTITVRQHTDTHTPFWGCYLPNVVRRPMCFNLFVYFVYLFLLCIFMICLLNGQWRGLFCLFWCFYICYFLVIVNFCQSISKLFDNGYRLHKCACVMFVPVWQKKKNTGVMAKLRDCNLCHHIYVIRTMFSSRVHFTAWFGLNFV